MDVQGKIVITVDDDIETITILKKILGEAGITVQKARGIEELKAICNRIVPDLILLDVVLGKESGLEFLDQRFMNPMLQTIPVLMLSRHNDNDTVMRSLAMGADGYLIKPIQTDELLSKIGAVFKEKEEREHEFSAEDMPTVTIQTEACIISLSEFECVIESQAMLKDASSIRLDSFFIKDVAEKFPNMGMSIKKTSPSDAGGFLSHIGIDGIPEGELCKLRRMLLKWKEKKTT